MPGVHEEGNTTKNIFQETGPDLTAGSLSEMVIKRLEEYSGESPRVLRAMAQQIIDGQNPELCHKAVVKTTSTLNPVIPDSPLPVRNALNAVTRSIFSPPGILQSPEDLPPIGYDRRLIAASTATAFLNFLENMLNNGENSEAGRRVLFYGGDSGWLPYLTMYILPKGSWLTLLEDDPDFRKEIENNGRLLPRMEGVSIKLLESQSQIVNSQFQLMKGKYDLLIQGGIAPLPIEALYKGWASFIALTNEGLPEGTEVLADYSQARNEQDDMYIVCGSRSGNETKLSAARIPQKTGHTVLGNQDVNNFIAKKGFQSRK